MLQDTMYKRNHFLYISKYQPSVLAWNGGTQLSIVSAKTPEADVNEGPVQKKEQNK